MARKYTQLTFTDSVKDRQAFHGNIYKGVIQIFVPLSITEPPTCINGCCCLILVLIAISPSNPGGEGSHVWQSTTTIQKDRVTSQ